MDELLEQFLIESRDLIAAASRDFASLARNPHGTGSIDSAFRAIHTLKGSVAIFDMGPAEQVLHAAEDILERARKGTAELDEATVASLVACLDQVDRWVDEIEKAGALLPQASDLAGQLVSGLTEASPSTPAAGPIAEAANETWVADLLAREAAALAGPNQALTAFRYTPDADSFFRGDDPLAVVAAVPDLLSLAILPVQGKWPVAADFEPFVCLSVLEGISAAPRDRVAAAFRLMPDQVAFAVLDQSSEQTIGQNTEHEVRGNRILRVDSERVDALGDALGELLVALNGVAPLADHAATFDRSLAGKIRSVQADLERAASDLRTSVNAVRAVRLEPTLRRVPRLVREIAESLGKTVHFEITGQDIEIDKQIADGLFEPLLHLVRNAIDHGIECGNEREACGKPMVGRVSLDFHREGDAVLALLRDDGAGMDPERIRKVASERGVLSPEAAEALSDAAAIRLIFAPGFSTAETVTELSGRGVGMNAVETAVEALRGTIGVESALGAGTTITMRFPANALTQRLLVIEAGGERYGISLDQIVETVGVDNDRLLPVGSGFACVLHGRTVPVLSLAGLLGGRDRDQAIAKLVVTRSGGEAVALRVDGFGERIDTLVRRPTGMLSSVPGVTGSALLADGGVLLVLDLPELAA
ncbi:chemotaxis protein CheW [Novosphingobium sp. PS1R-30]|uniref:histidine kinase n=1 Tax=Novosphingobium anseongense TaxID=3133436 RepID=A0ABU8S312_9SPHN